MKEINEGMIELVSCELRLGPGEDDVLRYKLDTPKRAWEQLNEYGKIAYKNAAIDVMMEEINEFVSARR